MNKLLLTFGLFLALLMLSGCPNDDPQVGVEPTMPPAGETTTTDDGLDDGSE